jgi:hypothetical protein
MNETPAASAADRTDQEQLRLLAIFHYVVGGLIVAFSCLFVVYIVMGVMFVVAPEFFEGRGDKNPPPVFLGYFMAGIGSLFLLTGWTAGGLTVYSGRCLAARARRMLSLVTAGIICLFMPFGTVLGVLTIIVLCRDSVRRLYGE